MKATGSFSRDVTHTTLVVFFIGLLTAASFWVLRPFIISIIWSFLIVVASWPVLLRLQAWLFGRRGLAVAVMTATLMLIIFVPLTLAVITMVHNSEHIAARTRSLVALAMSPPPAWLDSIPLVGGSLSARWRDFAALTPEQRSTIVTPYARKALQWFLSQAGGFGMMMVNFLLTVIIAAIMYAKGEIAAKGALAFARRLAGVKGEEVAVLAARAVRGVALGIVLTALIQAAFGGIGLAVTGVPAAALLTAVMFMLCLAQLGPALVLVPAVIWLYMNDRALAGTVMLVFSILAVTVDNIIRPLFIKKESHLPLVMVIAGVVGGLIAFGIVGLFIGPVLLAVTYTLLKAWVSGGGPEDAEAPPGSEKA